MKLNIILYFAWMFFTTLMILQFCSSTYEAGIKDSKKTLEDFKREMK